MSENQNHLIEKVIWDTLFDNKERAIELQNRISVWSKFKMIEKLNQVFDDFCPVEETWKIESLNIDLGKIDLENLEEALEKELILQLRQKLSDLRAKNNSDELSIAITDHHQKKALSTANIKKQKLPINKANTSIFIKNAGLVLMNNYIPILFERLGIVNEQKQYLPNKQVDAVHYLQFVISWLTHTEESYLALNKVLCGVPINQSVKAEIELKPNEKELIEQLLQAMIAYWPSIGSSSMEGFRGNWLVRDGVLMEHDDKWELTVEKRAYDILIHQSPFSFSIIKYPWMDKPLHVNWPY